MPIFSNLPMTTYFLDNADSVAIQIPVQRQVHHPDQRRCYCVLHLSRQGQSYRVQASKPSEYSFVMRQLYLLN